MNIKEDGKLICIKEFGVDPYFKKGISYDIVRIFPVNTNDGIVTFIGVNCDHIDRKYFTFELEKLVLHFETLNMNRSKKLKRLHYESR